MNIHQLQGPALD